MDTGGALHLVSHDSTGSRETDVVSDKNRDIGQITQIEVFDMDRDGYDDIVILDILGQLSVFYGSSNQEFFYQFIDHVFDFSFAEKSLFSGAAYYQYPGFNFPDFTRTQDPLLKSQQEQLQSVLFSSVTIPDNSSASATLSNQSVGTQIAQSFSVDSNAGAGNSLSNLANEFDSLTSQY